jgi:hypothetical protein
MRFFHKNWRMSPMQHLCVVLLGFAVFSWGTEYKYSLYYAQSPGQPLVQPAKLLSQKERPPQSRRIRVGATPSKRRVRLHAFAPVFAIKATAIFHRMRMACIATPPGRTCSSLQTASLTYFAFRPPPAQS